MTANCQHNMQYIPYKEIAKQKAREYYHKNKERIQEQAKNKYKSPSPEGKKKRQEYNKEWFKKTTNRKTTKIKRKSKTISKK